MNQPLLLDVDGVLADFKADLLRAVGSELAPSEITTYEIFNYLTRSQAAFAKDILDDSSFWRTLTPMPGAIASVTRLRQEGFDVIFVTSPWSTCSGWTESRRAWLTRHFGAHPDSDVLPIKSTRKHLVAGCAFVEDSPETLMQWCRSQRGFGVLFDQPYNQAGFEHFPRMSAWSSDSVTWLVERIREAVEAA